MTRVSLIINEAKYLHVLMSHLYMCSWSQVSLALIYPKSTCFNEKNSLGILALCRTYPNITVQLSCAL